MNIEELTLVEEMGGFMERARQVLNDDLNEFYNYKYPDDNYQAGAMMKYGIAQSETRLNIVLDYLIATQQKLDQLAGTFKKGVEADE